MLPVQEGPFFRKKMFRFSLRVFRKKAMFWDNQPKPAQEIYPRWW